MKRINIKRNISIGLILILAVTMCFFMGCSPNEQENGEGNGETGTPSLTFTSETLPSMDGATALAPYYEAAAATVMQMDVEEARQYVMCNKTDGAYNNLISGAVDMIFCSMPSKEQQAMADAAGIEFETIPFLNGGFVFFVNQDNPVDSLSIEQLHDIYAGKIINWKEVGGEDKEIVAYQRPDNSGSQTGMYEYVISEDEIMEAPTEKVIADMGGIIDAVATYDNSESAIGYSYYYYVTNMHASEKIKLIQIDGIMPSDETIASSEYPIINPSLMIINKTTPEDSPVRSLIQWILSDEGKQVAWDNGYIPIGSK